MTPTGAAAPLPACAAAPLAGAAAPPPPAGAAAPPACRRCPGPCRRVVVRTPARRRCAPACRRRCAGVPAGTAALPPPAGAAAAPAQAPAGPSDWSCFDTQEFSGIEPTCTAAKCNPISLSAECDATACSNKVTGEECLVSCSDGWTMDGYASLYECLVTGTLCGTEPTCIPNESTESVPSDGDLSVPGNCANMTTGESCTVSCADGYSGIAESFECKASRSVTGSVPTCTAAVCPNTVPVGDGQSSRDCDSKSLSKHVRWGPDWQPACGT